MSYRRGVSDAIKFGYSVGRVRALEGHLLSNAALERLLDAADFAEQKRVLADTEYGSCLTPCETPTEVEMELDTYLEGLFEFIETSRLPESVSRFFRARYDFLNMKGRLKAEALDVPVADLLEAHGTVPVAQFEGPLESLPRHLRELDPAVRDSRGQVDRHLIDPIIDAAMYADILDSAKASGCKALIDIAGLTIDLANLKTVVRAKALQWPAAQVWPALVSGGAVSTHSLMSGYGQPFRDMVERLVSITRLPGVDADDLMSIGHLDVVADNLLMRHSRRARRMATGVEPVIGYVMARHSELVIVRTLLLGRLAGVSADALRPRMRELYA